MTSEGRVWKALYEMPQNLYNIAKFGLKLSKNCQISKKSPIRFGWDAKSFHVKAITTP